VLYVELAYGHEYMHIHDKRLRALFSYRQKLAIVSVRRSWSVQSPLGFCFVILYTSGETRSFDHIVC
ncbi:hypothetical protein BgiBS90_009010, partial [Biomphalaria glabrata]